MNTNLINNLILNVPINLKYCNLGILNQPTLGELIEVFGNEYDMVVPFETTEILHHKMINESDKGELKRFYIFLELDSILNNVVQKQRNNIIKALCLVYKVTPEEITFYTDTIDNASIIIKNRDVFVDVNNFDKLLTSILFMFNKTREEVCRHSDKEDEDKWVKKSNSKREAEMIEFFKQRERERAEKERIKFHDFVNYVIALGNYSYKDIRELTYFQFKNLTDTLVKMKDYNDNLGYLWSFKFDMPQDKMKPWSKSIKYESKFILD